jgi:hypothetical protein
MPQNMIFASLITLGLAFTATTQSEAGQTKQHAVSKKLKAGGSQSRAQPGDTCLGAPACNTLIVECVISGLDFKPIQTNGPNGEPTYGQCVKRTD